MKNFKNALPWGLSLFVILLLLPIENTVELNIHAERFCAYGQVYVEFTKGSRVWGTTFLDEFGKTVTCNRNNENIVASGMTS